MAKECLDARRMESGFWWGSSATWLRLLELAISLNKAIRFPLTLADIVADLYDLQFSHTHITVAAAAGAD